MSATVISDNQSAPSQRWGFRVRLAPALDAPFDDDPLETGPMHAFARPDHDGGRAVIQPALPAGPPGPAATRYVQVCLEVLNGFRPASHLRTLTGPVEFDDVLRQLRFRRNSAHNGASSGTRATHGNAVRQVPKTVNVGTGDRGRQSNAARLGGSPLNTARAADAFRLRRLRVTEPVPGVAEVVAVLMHGGAALALAMRLEARGATWVCTVVQVV